jgi:DNA-directed RNA polymerase subunit RPC12/RpoP
MSHEDKIRCPSCGSDTEFIKTCIDCGHSYCPWCRVRHVDDYKVLMPEDTVSCPRCGSNEPGICKE